MQHLITRRRALGNVATLFSSALLHPYVNDILHRKKPWRVGLIGCGWYGTSDLLKLIQVAHVEIVGLCDVDEKNIAQTLRIVQERTGQTRIATFHNYQQLLAEGLDIVVIGTPDHWHALQGIDAIQSGAHLYLQKPISVDVLEGEVLVQTARDLNKVVQIGLQRRSTPHLINAKENVIEAGLLGKIARVEMCCYYHMRGNIKNQVVPIPEHLDFDQWCGPAPVRAYNQSPHRGWWRAFMEYSNGIMGDMCVHMLDTVRWLLDLGWPTEISSIGGIYVQKESLSNTADTQNAVFKFPELECIWNHRSWGTPPDPEYPWAFFIYGEKGTLKGSVHKYEFIPRGSGEHLNMDAVYEREQFPEDLNEPGIELHTAAATRGQFVDLLYAIENGGTPLADIHEGHISTASCILANISMVLGRPLKYDPMTKRVVGDPEATNLLARKYREGYVHPSE